MRPRGFVITVAAVLAILATGAVYLYVRNVQNNNGGGTTVSVVVAKQDIAVGAKLDDVISQGGVTFRRFPKADVVRGAVTNISEIKGTVTNAPIVAGEQISTARLVGSVTQPTGGALGIPQGDQALTISLQAPQAGGGVVQQGDHVAIYAVFTNITLIRGSIADFLAGKAGDGAGQRMPDFITTVVPEVPVLKVVQGVISASSQQANVSLTLALKPGDAARVVLAQQKGTLWLTLLPPNQQGQTIPPSGLFDLIGAKGPQAA